MQRTMELGDERRDSVMANSLRAPRQVPDNRQRPTDATADDHTERTW